MVIAGAQQFVSKMLAKCWPGWDGGAVGVLPASVMGVEVKKLRVMRDVARFSLQVCCKCAVKDA